MTQNWRGAISELIQLGCSIKAFGENLTVKWEGKGNPPSREKFSSLLEVLKTHKEEILGDPHFLMDQILREINETLLRVGFLNYLKFSRSGTWQTLLQLETKINECVFKNDLSGLKRTLNEYKNLIAEAGRQFEPTGKQRELSFQEGACKEEETWIKKTSVM